MTSILRGKVSKNKRRFVDKKNGFDLDLSYITEKIIAMGFPSENMEGLYRNNMTDVIRFLDLRHKEHYKVYNLCSERSYDHQKFYNRVEVFPFDDHNAPRFELMEAFCKNVQVWLDEHPENVAAIHCKAGKGRTGVMICAYLLYNNTWGDPEEAMQFYGAMRTFNIKGVTIPSQIRYIRYFSKSLKSGLPHLQSLRLNRIILHKDIKYENDIKFKLYEYDLQLYKYQQKCQRPKSKKKGKTDPTNDSEEDKIIFEVDDCPPLSGDIKVVFFDTGRSGKVLFTFWFNTRFIEENQLVLTKKELDKANKDKNHKVYHQDFNVELSFKETESQALEPTSTTTSGVETNLESIKSLSLVRENNTQVNVAEFVQTLLRDLIGILAAYSPNWTNINADILRQFASTREFTAITEGLQFLSQLDMTTLRNARERLAFWLNAYHLLLLHSVIIKARDGALQGLKQNFFTFLGASVFPIATHSFTLLEILFCCLLPSFSIPENHGEEGQLSTPKFSKSDVRGQWALPKAETRVLCVLWEPFFSGSQLSLFYALSVNEELESRARKYLAQNVEVDPSGEVVLPRIFSLWPEVQKSGKAVAKWLAEYHPNKITQKQLQKSNKAFFRFPEDKFQEPENSTLSLSLDHLKRDFVSYLPADRQQEVTAQLEQQEKTEPLSRERRGASISFLDNLKHKKVSGLISSNNHHSLNSTQLSALAATTSSAPSSPLQSTSATTTSSSGLASLYSVDSLPVVSSVYNSATPAITPRPSLISTPSTPVLGLARLSASRSVPHSNPIGSSSLSRNEIDHDLLEQDQDQDDQDQDLEPLSEPESETEEEQDEESSPPVDHDPLSPSDSTVL